MSSAWIPTNDLRLPERLRSALAKPFGPIVQTDALSGLLANRTVVAVGDVVSMTLRELGINPWLFVCDYKTQRGEDSDLYRKHLGNWGDRALRVRNPAGTVTVDAWATVARALTEPQDTITRIVVEGEEDLLGLPVFSLAPDGVCVVYGMPNEGVVVAIIDDEIRQRANDLISQMSSPRG